MTKNNNATGKLPLTSLINILEDAENVYLNAAERIDGIILPLLFRNFGYQKNRYSLQLKTALKKSGWTSSITEYASVNLIQTWKDHLTTSFRAGQQRSLIQACIKGEEGTLANYQMVIEQMKNNNELKMLLLQQVNGIKTVLNTIKTYSSFGNN